MPPGAGTAGNGPVPLASTCRRNGRGGGVDASGGPVEVFPPGFGSPTTPQVGVTLTPGASVAISGGTLPLWPTGPSPPLTRSELG